METNNKRFSIEDIFNIVEVQNTVISVNFIFGSKSYSKYKYGVTLVQITNTTSKDVINKQHKIFTYGEIQGKVYNNTPPMSKDVIPISFDTNDIDEIEYYMR